MARIGIAAMDSRSGFGGGLDVYTFQLVNALAQFERKHSYTVLTSASTYDKWIQQAWPDHIKFVALCAAAPSSQLFFRGVRFLKRIWGFSIADDLTTSYLTYQIDNLGLDVVHFPRTTIYPLSLKTPCVLTCFDLQQEYYPEFFTPDELRQRARTYRPSVEKARRVIAPTQFTARTLIDKYGISKQKLTVIPVGITKTFRRTSEEAVSQVRTKYGLPSKFLFYPANPWPHKNHARLMAALRYYQDCYQEPIHLVISGRLQNEPCNAMLYAIAAGIQHSVIDLAFVAEQDLPAIYSAAEMLVFPSLFEGFGIPLIEAAACGCPIVAANTTTIPEVTMGAALLFDPMKPQDIASAIHRMRHDSSLQIQLVEQGRRQLDRFNWEVIVSQISEVYDGVVRDIVRGPERH